MRKRCFFIIGALSLIIVGCSSYATSAENVEEWNTETVESEEADANITVNSKFSTTDIQEKTDALNVSVEADIVVESDDSQAQVDMLSSDAYLPLQDEEGNNLETGNVVQNGEVDVGTIYEETGAVVISISWDWVGYENQCCVEIEAQYDREDLVINGYGCGTAYYDSDGNVIAMEFGEMHDDKIYDTLLIFAKDDVSITVSPELPNNDAPVREASIKIADSKGVRSLNVEDIYWRSYTGIWFDAVCTIKNGVAEQYEGYIVND